MRARASVGFVLLPKQPQTVADCKEAHPRAPPQRTNKPDPQDTEELQSTQVNAKALGYITKITAIVWYDGIVVLYISISQRGLRLPCLAVSCGRMHVCVQQLRVVLHWSAFRCCL